MCHAGKLERELPRYRSLHLKSPVPAPGLTLGFSFHSRKKNVNTVTLPQRTDRTHHSFLIYPLVFLSTGALQG